MAIRSQEEAIGRDDLAPEEALAELIRLKFNYHMQHPEFVRLVMVENIHLGEYVRDLDEARRGGLDALKQLSSILKRGRMRVFSGQKSIHSTSPQR